MRRLERLRTQWSPTPELRDVLTQVGEVTARIERLADDLWTLSQAGSGRLHYDLARVDLGAVVERVVTAVSAASSHAIQVDTRMAPLPAVADERQQVRILEELLGLAVRGASRSLTVAVERHRDRAVVRIAEAVRDAVTDQAGPVDERAMAGTDTDAGLVDAPLGVHVARVLVEGQGGSFWVEPTGQGRPVTCYTVPLATTGATT